jgi:stearoyl-CoA desaturase (Delta-9 desaturase)
VNIGDFFLRYGYGVLNLSVWGYIVAAAISIQITILCVTVYLHRDATHRSVDLHSSLRHFARFWIWFTAGMLTREWVSVHRKHHARCETADDPHSPVIYGLKKILLEGAELYSIQARDPEVQQKYGRGTPDDWIERNLYTKHRNYGIIALIVLDLVLFGPPGIIILATQLVAMPLFAAGIINGVGHHSGYRNFECPDAATNIVPWGIVLGGEELHNNHHAFPSSAKFSVRSWEFDIGWMWITLFTTLGLAKVNRVAPQPIEQPRQHIDLDTVRAVILNRMHVLRDYASHVTLPVGKVEFQNAGRRLSSSIKKVLIREPILLDASAKSKLADVLSHHQALNTVYEFRQRLQQIWDGGVMSNELLVAHLKEWIARAEASGIRSLQDFASRLRNFSMPMAIPA